MKARVEIDEQARTVTTTFEDGSQVVAVPQYDDESLARARALGYSMTATVAEEGIWWMTVDHDRLHHLMAEALDWPYSTALWHAAHPDEPLTRRDLDRIAQEERTVLLMARLLNEGLEAVWAERQTDG